MWVSVRFDGGWTLDCRVEGCGWGERFASGSVDDLHEVGEGFVGFIDQFQCIETGGRCETNEGLIFHHPSCCARLEDTEFTERKGGAFYFNPFWRMDWNKMPNCQPCWRQGRFFTDMFILGGIRNGVVVYWGLSYRVSISNRILLSVILFGLLCYDDQE